MMAKIKISIFAFTLITMSVIGCNTPSTGDRTTDTMSTNNETLTSDNETEFQSKHLKEDERKVYGNLKFGATRKEYKSLYPNKTYKIMDHEFEFIPYFDRNEKLYKLELRSKEKDDGKTWSFPLISLQRLLQEQYGEAQENTSIDRKEDLFHTGPSKGKIETKIWHIGSKSIVLTSIPVKRESGNRQIYDYYPRLTITETTLASEENKYWSDAQKKQFEKKFHEEASKF